ncbi:MAG: Uma2 family endonuclease [Acidobacteria bacterium]|nr:Uma2 family endonuclease [Acidobacteriota bacterium]
MSRVSEPEGAAGRYACRPAGTGPAEGLNGRRMALDEFLALPEGTPGQLLGGEVVMTPAPTPYHQVVSRRLEFALLRFVEDNGSGQVFDSPLDVFLSDGDVLQPDLLFIARERESIIGPARVEGAPDLVVEILSPGSAYDDLRRKYRIYAGRTRFQALISISSREEVPKPAAVGESCRRVIRDCRRLADS